MENGEFTYLLLYVDNMLIASHNEIEIKRLKSLLGSEFEMKHIGTTEKILEDKDQREIEIKKKFFLC